MISNYSYCIPFLASDEGEGDATEARLAAKTKQLASYDEPDEDDAEMADAGRSLEAEEAELEAAAKAAGDEDEEQDNMDEDNSENTKHLDRKAVKESKYVVRWEFDEENGAWCEMDMKVYIYISVYAKYLLPCLLNILICCTVPRWYKEDSYGQSHWKDLSEGRCAWNQGHRAMLRI